MILITGGTGVMGRALIKGLNKNIRVLTLPDDPNARAVTDADIIYGDVSESDTIQGCCENVETVYHLAAVIISFNDEIYTQVNLEGTRNVVNEAVKAGVQHFIYISSASVVYPKTTAYSRSKRQAEKIVRESGLNYTIVRPTLVYDYEGSVEFDIFLDYLRLFPVVPFIGSGRAIKRPVFVEDVIAGLISLHGNPVSYGKTYNLSGGEEISIIDFARLCLELMGLKNRPIVSIPVWLCMLLSKAMGFLMKRPPLRWPVIAGITQDANLLPDLAREELEYRPVKVSVKLPECFPRK